MTVAWILLRTCCDTLSQLILQEIDDDIYKSTPVQSQHIANKSRQIWSKVVSRNFKPNTYRSRKFKKRVGFWIWGSPTSCYRHESGTKMKLCVSRFQKAHPFLRSTSVDGVRGKTKIFRHIFEISWTACVGFEISWHNFEQNFSELVKIDCQMIDINHPLTITNQSNTRLVLLVTYLS